MVVLKKKPLQIDHIRVEELHLLQNKIRAIPSKMYQLDISIGSHKICLPSLYQPLLVCKTISLRLEIGAQVVKNIRTLSVRYQFEINFQIGGVNQTEIICLISSASLIM